MLKGIWTFCPSHFGNTWNDWLFREYFGTLPRQNTHKQVRLLWVGLWKIPAQPVMETLWFIKTIANYWTDRRLMVWLPTNSFTSGHDLVTTESWPTSPQRRVCDLWYEYLWEEQQNGRDAAEWFTTTRSWAILINGKPRKPISSALITKPRRHVWCQWL